MKRTNHRIALINQYKEKSILDVGCGERKIPGATGLDIAPFRGVDVIHNLNVFPYPFKDEQFELITMNHVIEHVRDIPATINELARILQRGGALMD